MMANDAFTSTSDALDLHVERVPWDSDLLGVPVAAIRSIRLHDARGASAAYAEYEAWAGAQQIQLVSCRLPQDRMEESMFLQRRGFRVIEMVLHPVMRGLETLPPAATSLAVLPVPEEEVAAVAGMAERAFGFERYHADPRVESRLADLRYARWIANSRSSQTQALLKIVRGDEIVAFFLVEHGADKVAYWHLTAVNPAFQGQGLGADVWRAMMAYHRDAGMQGIRTTISARNTPVLNLYSKLNFRFEPPELTLHWMRSDP